MKIEKKVEQLTVALGQLLLKYRTENNLTRAVLVGRLGISESRIRQLESGGGPSPSFNIEILIALADEMKISYADLMNKLLDEAKLSSVELPQLQDSFANSIQGTSAVAMFHSAQTKTDEIFGNHFSWSLKMAEMLLRLDDIEKARLEIALRRASPLRTSEEYKERTMFLLDYELDN